MSGKKKITIGIIIFIIILVILAILVYLIFNKKKETTVDAIGNISGNIFKESAEELQNATNIIENVVKENKVATQVIQEETNQDDTTIDNSSDSNSINKSNSQTKTNNSNKSTTSNKSQTTNSGSNDSKKEQTQTPAQTQQPSSEPPKQETAYWCVDGGTHHVAGDGANEHGYYSSWDSAYQAFEQYTKDWTSCQYKINQCACGKYYFWAIK